jgi:hypothetical protein
MNSKIKPEQREMQFNMNKKKEDFQGDLEEQWRQTELDNLKEYNCKMLAKLEAEHMKKTEVQKTLKNQLKHEKRIFKKCRKITSKVR